MTRMGDLIQSTPVISGLNEKYPEARITLLVTSDFSEFAARIPHVDEIKVLNLRQFIDAFKDKTKNWVDLYHYFEEFLTDLKNQKFDFLVNLSHSKLSAFMILYLKIKKHCGFGCNEVGDRLANHPWMQYFGTEPFNRIYNPFNLVEIFTRSVDALPENKCVEILSLSEDEKSASDLMVRNNIQEEDFLIGIQAGSSLENRRWPSRHFSELLELLLQDKKVKILIFGVESEFALAEEIRLPVGNKARVINLAGKTNISQLAGLVGKCRYLITNDTGTMHIAAALGTKIVGLFFAHAHPFETGPYGPEHLIFQARIPCAPCSYGVQCNNIICVEKVSPQMVYSMIEEHRMHGDWSFHGDPGDHEELNIVHTFMDEDQRLKLEPLIKHPVRIGDIFSTIYDPFWLASLEKKSRYYCDVKNILNTLMRNFDCRDIETSLPMLAEKNTVLQDLKRESEKGMRATREIVRALSRGGINLEAIRLIGNAIERIDEEIDRTGNAHPELKPISDMFAKRKENFQGDDTLALANASLLNYKKLKQESRRMGILIEELTGYLLKNLAENPQIMHNSISVAVPGE